MKKIFAIIMMGLLLVACSDENESARTPVASATISETELEINQSAQISFTGVADQVVVWPGDEGHSYANRKAGDTGFAMNKGHFSYSYSVPGEFHVVVVASTYDTYMGGSLSTDTIAFDVVVKDDVTTIDRVYSSITPNVYYAELLEESSDWVLRLPSKQVYNNREVTLKAEKQRLSFDIESDSSKIYVDDVLWTAKTYYDLTKTHSIKVESDFGSVRDYKLYTLIYPEFTSISLNGVDGVLVRNAFNQDALTYQFTLPEGTDKRNVPLLHNIKDGDKFYINGSEIQSGATIDLTQGGNYTLVTTSPENSRIKATSNITFKIL